MSIFTHRNKQNSVNDQALLAEMALKSIQDGVVMTDRNGVIEFINPAACVMTGYGNNAIGLDYGLVIKLESKVGRELPDNENPLILAMNSGQPLQKYQGSLIVGNSDKRIPVAISMAVADGASQDRVITFRDITRELEEEGEQTEFISTASHEMRTPVATIDGYLSLTLNPQTATIDERARGYLTAAQNASRHLGKLFQNLLDVTKLDDGRIRPNFVPVNLVEMVETISKDYEQRAREAKINYTFGSDSPISFGGESRKLQQVAYSSVDVNFMREILDNLIDNALKYTPSGGSVYVNVRGDGDRVLINVTDTGMGISSDDLAHIFQKFYRADNSDTRTIGGTGLGLYLVKQRAEAMGGKVWAESAFGEGSTFYVSLPRLTDDEYEKRMIMVRNLQMAQSQTAQSASQRLAQPMAQPVVQPMAQTVTQPMAQPVVQPAIRPTPQPASQPIAQMTPQLVMQPPRSAPTTQSQGMAQPGQVQSQPVQQNNSNLNGEVK